MARTPHETAKLLLAQLVSPSLSQGERDNAYHAFNTVLRKILN